MKKTKDVMTIALMDSFLIMTTLFLLLTILLLDGHIEAILNNSE